MAVNQLLTHYWNFRFPVLSVHQRVKSEIQAFSCLFQVCCCCLGGWGVGVKEETWLVKMLMWMWTNPKKSAASLEAIECNQESNSGEETAGSNLVGGKVKRTRKEFIKSQTSSSNKLKKTEIQNCILISGAAWHLG